MNGEVVLDVDGLSVGYVRRDGSIGEHTLPPHPLLDFEGPEHEGQLRSILDPILTRSGAAA